MKFRHSRNQGRRSLLVCATAPSATDGGIVVKVSWTRSSCTAGPGVQPEPLISTAYLEVGDTDHPVDQALPSAGRGTYGGVGMLGQYRNRSTRIMPACLRG